MPSVLAAPDKFRGTATAIDVAAAVARAAARAGWACDQAPVADGGEGLLDVMGGTARRTVVKGPLGTRVEAEWRMRDDGAVVEMARASGLVLAGGGGGNHPAAGPTGGGGPRLPPGGQGGGTRGRGGGGGGAARPRGPG